MVFSKPREVVQVTSFYVLQPLCSAGVETMRTTSKTCSLREGKVQGGSHSTAVVDIRVDEQSAVLVLCDYHPLSYQPSLQSGLT